MGTHSFILYLAGNGHLGEKPVSPAGDAGEAMYVHRPERGGCTGGSWQRTLLLQGRRLVARPVNLGAQQQSLNHQTDV